MPTTKQQSFRNHASLDPSYHFVASAALLVNLVIGVILIVMSLHTQLLLAVWIVILSIVLILMYIKLRVYPLKIQDRVIRLEERLRLAVLLPEPVRLRIPELTVDQLIGLRFASDAELPGLVERTLRENLTRKQIKQAVVSWRADDWRV